MVAVSTRKAYERALRDFNLYCKNEGLKYGNSVPRAIIESYVVHLLTVRKLTARNIKSRLAGVHALLKMVNIEFEHGIPIVQ